MFLIVIIIKVLDLSHDVGLSHLPEHKFKHSFQDCRGLNIESTSQFLLHCPLDCKLLQLTNSSLSQILRYSSTLFDKEKNTFILDANIEYILSTERFEELLA